MLNLTDDATRAIDGLVGNRGPDAGLRITSEHVQDGKVQLAVSIADRPEPTDEVVEQSGCRVFLDAQAAPVVDGATLDTVETGGERAVRFAFVKSS